MSKKNKKKNPAEFDLLGFLAQKMQQAVIRTADGHYIDNPLFKCPNFVEKIAGNMETKEIPAWLYDRLNALGIIPNDVRDHNVGESDYTQHLIQPWAIWLDHDLNPWDADIIKRVLRKRKPITALWTIRKSSIFARNG